MAKPYSMDLRERVIARVEAGESVRSIAKALQVSVSSVVKWAQRKRQTGSVAPGKMGGHRPPHISGDHRAWLLDRIAKDGNVTLHGLEKEFSDRGLVVDHATIGRFLHRERQSYKKNASACRTEPA